MFKLKYPDTPPAAFRRMVEARNYSSDMKRVGGISYPLTSLGMRRSGGSVGAVQDLLELMQSLGTRVGIKH